MPDADQTETVGLLERLGRSLYHARYYRQPQPIQSKHLGDMVSPGGDLDDAKRAITAGVLAAVGLKLDGRPLRGVYLTKSQRTIKTMVEEQGYRVGLP